MSDSEEPTETTAPRDLGVGEKVVQGIQISGSFIYDKIIANIVGFLIPTLFSAIFAILKIVAIILYYLFAKIVPFMVVYFGIPLFILGAMMALLFVGGHMFFLVAFFIGVYFYIKGVFNIKLRPPKLTAEVEATL